MRKLWCGFDKLLFGHRLCAANKIGHKCAQACLLGGLRCERWLVVVGLGLVLQLLPWRGGIFALVERGLLFAFVAALGWTAIAVVNASADLYLRRIPAGSEDSALTRKHLTQVRLLRRIIVIVIGFLTLAAVLVEVVILAIMMSNEPSPTLVRDTIYSAVIF